MGEIELVCNFEVFLELVSCVFSMAWLIPCRGVGGASC